LQRLQPLDLLGLNRRLGPLIDRLSGIASRTGARLIRPTDSFCGADVCPATDSHGNPLYKDADHLTATALIQRAIFIDDMLRQ
jgi:hypothetical protein